MAALRKPTGRAATYTLFTLVVLSSAFGNLSQTAVNAMLVSIVSDFGVGLHMGQLTTTGYMLTLGIVVPVATYLSRRVCARTHTLIGMLLFVAGSAIDLVAWNFGVLLVGRLMQAAAAGVLMPLMQNIAMLRFPPGRQATAMGLCGIAMGFAPNIGPTIGGWMAYALGWRSFFLLLMAANVVLAILALVLLEREPAAFPQATFDVPSFVFSTLGFGGVLLGVSNASGFGLQSPYIWAPLAVGAVFLVLFFWRQGRAAQPLMHLSIFKNRQYVSGLVCLILLMGSFMGVTLVIPLFVQDLWGGTSLDAGLVILPSTVVALVMNPLSGILTDKLGARIVVLVDGAFLVAGSVLAIVPTQTTPLWVIALFQAVRSVGVSGLIGPLQSWSLARMEGSLVPDGSSASVLLRQVGASVGTAVMVLLIQATVAAPVASALPALPYQLAFAFSALLAAGMYLVALVRVR